ncbi:MAG: hypothetical protein QNJ90_11335 [Planctomycetota bacterium]|nr:hypothetical protein [Planctomycetota bacterium]
MTDTSPEAPGPSTPWRRYLMIGVPIIAVVVAVVVIWWPKWEIQLAINGLHASDGRARAGHIETLKNHPDRELVIDELLDSVQDDGHTFGVRKLCCGLLVNHFNRLSKLTPLLTSGSLHTRGVILDTLAHQDYFENEFLEDPRYRIRETIVEWLRNDGDTTRMHAVQLASQIRMKEVMPDIRPLMRRSGRTNVHAREERDLMIAAAGAVERFKDCESAATLLEVADKDPDPLVRLRFMQILERTVFRKAPAAPCPGALDEAPMKALVQKSLDDPEHTVRMGAMLILARQPGWTEAVTSRLEAILDGNDAKPAERRQALSALVALGQPAFLERFPQYFHDASVEVRRTAARSVLQVADQGFEGCWIGLLTDEAPESGVAIEQDGRHMLWRDALQYLRRHAKGFRGFPNLLIVRAAQDKVQFAKDMASMFLDGEVVVAATDGTMERVTRDGVTEAWFRWWCEDRGLDAEKTEQAVAVWRASHAARKRGDVPAAKAALDGLDFDAAGLFTYERAWLAVHSR